MKGREAANHWSELDPAYASCNAGKEQSPIDIEASEKTAIPALRFESEERTAQIYREQRLHDPRELP